jgi:hypothetical protein
MIYKMLTYFLLPDSDRPRFRTTPDVVKDVGPEVRDGLGLLKVGKEEAGDEESFGGAPSSARED